MKKEKDPNVYLRHILESIERIEVNLKRVTKTAFMNDTNLQDIIVRRLEIIGEAVKNVPESFRKQHRNIPWRSMAGSRDKLIHEYFDVDLELVWEIASKDITALKKQVTALMKNMF